MSALIEGPIPASSTTRLPTAPAVVVDPRAAAAAERQRRFDRELDQELAQLAADTRKRRIDQAIIAGSLLTLILLATTFSLYFGRIKDDERVMAAQETAYETQTRQLAEARSALDGEKKQVADLTAALRAARQDPRQAAPPPGAGAAPASEAGNQEAPKARTQRAEAQRAPGAAPKKGSRNVAARRATRTS